MIQATDNQLLSILPTSHETVFKVDMRGVVQLKDSRFKGRHIGLKDVKELPGKKFAPLAEYKKLFPKEFTKKTGTKKVPAGSGQSLFSPSDDAQEKPPRQYKIHKGKIIDRLNTFYLGLRGEKLMFFWTVTFPQGTTEKVAHRLFNIWLTRCRSELNLRPFLWIKERQENGTPHFHLVLHQRMPVVKANKFMRVSILHAIEAGEINWPKHMAGKYNGIDIAKDRKTKRITNFAKQKHKKSLQRYLTKYVTKNNGDFEMLAWHCSRDYSNTVVAVAMTFDELEKFGLVEELLLVDPYENDFIRRYYFPKGPPGWVTRYFTSINMLAQGILSTMGIGIDYGVIFPN